MDPFKNLQLDTYEQDIEQAFARGSYDEASRDDSLLKRLQKASKNTSVKDATVNFRVNKYDLLRFKARAQERGIPYQTLLTSIIHNYGRELESK